MYRNNLLVSPKKVRWYADLTRLVWGSWSWGLPAGNATHLGCSSKVSDMQCWSGLSRRHSKKIISSLIVWSIHSCFFLSTLIFFYIITNWAVFSLRVELPRSTSIFLFFLIVCRDKIKLNIVIHVFHLSWNYFHIILNYPHINYTDFNVDSNGVFSKYDVKSITFVHLNSWQ